MSNTEKATGRQWSITLRESGIDGCSDIELRHPECKCSLGDAIPDEVAEYVIAAVNHHDELIRVLEWSRMALAFHEAIRRKPGEENTRSDLLLAIDKALIAVGDQ